MNVDRPHVVVLGGGFGGLSFCQHFRHAGARITVVDRTNHHLFQPLLYQVAMAGLSAPDIAQPIRSILSRHDHLEVLMDEVTDLDLPGKRVICRHNELKYDYLIMAVGSVTSYFGHPEWAKFAPGLKTLDDALGIRRNILMAFERAETEKDNANHDRLMTIAVVGGGPTGVEMAGACADLAKRVLRRDFDHIDPTHARIILIEGGPRVLGHMAPDASASAQKQLEKLGVQVHTGIAVKDIQEHRITLANGEEIVAENILWTAGVKAHPLTAKLGAELDRAGRVKTLPDLSLPGHPEVFVIGDLAAVLQADGKPVPGVAPAAMQMAKHAARLITNELNAGTGATSARPPFRYHDKGTLATIGRAAAVADFGKIKLHGLPAWLSWLVIHLLFLVGFRNKLSVLISWTYYYFTYRLGARIIVSTPQSDGEVKRE